MDPMQHHPIVGQKRPGEGETQLPVGFGMALAQDTGAMAFFSSLSGPQQQEVVAYIQNSATGEEAKARISHAVSMMRRRDADFTDL